MAIRTAKHSAVRDADADCIMVTLAASAAKTDFTPVVFKAPESGAITSAVLIPNGAVTASDSDYLTHRLLNVTDSTYMMTGVTTKSTGGTAMALHTAQTLTLTTTSVSSGDILAYEIVNTGSSGKAFPGAVLALKFVPSN